MSLDRPGLLGLFFFGLAALGQPAHSQSAPPAPENFPADFIDSRPILAYFEDGLMPDTVRGLLEELQRADRCGKDAQVNPNEACALVFYRLADERGPSELRPPLIMRAIYRTTDPKDPALTIMLMPDMKGDLQRYVDGDLYEPLRDIRANFCRQDNRMPDECRATASAGVLYRPLGILGKNENDRERIIPARSAGKHFALYLKPADAEWLKQQQMRDLCMQQFWDKPVMIC